MILVVDDDDDLSDWLREVIQKAGYYFDRAIDAPSAIYKLSRLEYALAFIDIGLPPPADGEILAKLVRDLDEPYGSLPLVGITGSTFRDASLGLFAEALRKPFGPHQVETLIRRYARPPIRDLHHAQSLKPVRG